MPFRLGTDRLPDYMDAVERHAIIKTLEDTHYNQTETARRLGITCRSLRCRINRLKIDVK